MSHALQLAENGRYTTRPNPRVGCVLVRGNDLIAEGWHYRAGEPHAEIHALKQAEEKGENVVGATAYVTLEPCSHHGRTGSCATALIEAGVSRVVYALKDPNPLVSGQGLVRLEEAGIQIDGPLLESQALAVNRGFIRRMQQQMPWVSCKLAMSMDGRTAMASGESQWITGPAARKDVQRLRARHCAIISSRVSVEQDNSRLTLRAEDLDLSSAGVPATDVKSVIAVSPIRVVIDSNLDIKPDAKLFEDILSDVESDIKSAVVIFTNKETPKARQEALLNIYPDKVFVERVDANEEGIHLKQVLSVLATKYECNEVMVEAGARLSGAFLQRGLVDELVMYQAPILLGSTARPLFDIPLQVMNQKLSLDIVDTRILGNDTRITAMLK